MKFATLGDGFLVFETCILEWLRVLRGNCNGFRKEVCYCHQFHQQS